ncbi:MAG: LD-carboxypeptidase [Desulfobulbus sp.]|nr:MAG: LD-carboxypeptidase [Desulfobulbus sp.]
MQGSSPILPPPLRRGDCIGIFSPAGPVRDEGRLAAGIRLLHELGFRTRLPQGTGGNCDYLAADDQSRAAELHALWADNDVQGLMAVRGGYGCLRILDHLDFSLLRARPKLLIGFSDLTVLLNAISARTGLVTVHGPMVSTLADSDRESLQALTALFEGQLHEYPLSGQVEVLRRGKGTGVLRGGNLATLAHLLGTPWEIDWHRALLFLEDTGEPMYKIDRMLTQLHLAGRLNTLAGLVLGSFDCGEETGTASLQEQVWGRVLELTAGSDYPIVGGFPLGHLRMNHPLPIGIPATLDCERGRLIMP